MNHYVYKITNIINGKKYIGKRSCKCSIEDDKYMGSGILLKKAFKKYGIKNFKKDILFICESEEEAFNKEYIELTKIRELKRWDDYYNIAHGGIGITSEESRKIWNNPEHIEKIRNSTKQRWNNLDYRNKMIKQAKGNENWLGKSHTEEHKKYMSELYKGRTFDSETKKKMSESKKGCKNPMYGKKAPNSKEVILLNIIKKFETLKEACEFVGLKSSSNIIRCCKGRRETAGKINGEPAKWMYYDDYLKLQEK